MPELFDSIGLPEIPLQQAPGAARVPIEEGRRGHDGSRSLTRGRIVKGRPCGLDAGRDPVLKQSGNLPERGRRGIGRIRRITGSGGRVEGAINQANTAANDGVAIYLVGGA